MSKELVKKSLHKFLDDNLDIDVTYNSNESEIEDITSLFSDQDLIYSGTPITEIVLEQDSNPFNTDLVLDGKVLSIDSLGISDTIASWDDGTSTVTLDNGFTQDITTSDEIRIIFDDVVYMKSPFGLIKPRTRLHDLGHTDRWDLYVKVKDDSDKTKINTEVQNIRDLIFSNKGNFTIYDNDLVTLLGYGKVDLSSYQEDEIIDLTSDIQSFLLSFLVLYWIDYLD